MRLQRITNMTQKEKQDGNYSLGEILLLLAKNYIEVKLTTDYQDSINGYGWHVRYFVQLFVTVEYCSKCKNNYNVDYKDDYYPFHHQHSHKSETVNIYTHEFMSEEDLRNTLLNFIQKPTP